MQPCCEAAPLRLFCPGLAPQPPSPSQPRPPAPLSSLQGLVAVYDLGGGTFDISILEISGGVFEVGG